MIKRSKGNCVVALLVALGIAIFGVATAFGRSGSHERAGHGDRGARHFVAPRASRDLGRRGSGNADRGRAHANHRARGSRDADRGRGHGERGAGRGAAHNRGERRGGHGNGAREGSQRGHGTGAQGALNQSPGTGAGEGQNSGPGHGETGPGLSGREGSNPAGKASGNGTDGLVVPGVPGQGQGLSQGEGTGTACLVLFCVNAPQPSPSPFSGIGGGSSAGTSILPGSVQVAPTGPGTPSPTGGPGAAQSPAGAPVPAVSRTQTGSSRAPSTVLSPSTLSPAVTRGGTGGLLLTARPATVGPGARLPAAGGTAAPGALAAPTARVGLRGAAHGSGRTAADAARARASKAPPNVIQRFVRVVPGGIWLALAAALAMATLGVASAVRAGRRVRRQAGEVAAVTAAALTDPLTGVLNRRGFTEAAERELARARRYDRPVALAFVDVRGLKAVNDSEGHLAGDRLLGGVAGLLKDSARADDVVGRIGGDELGLLLAEQSADGAAAVSERIRSQLPAHRAALGLRTHWDVTIGTAAFPEDGDSFDELLAAADRRLYQQRGIALR